MSEEFSFLIINTIDATCLHYQSISVESRQIKDLRDVFLFLYVVFTVKKYFTLDNKKKRYFSNMRMKLFIKTSL